MTAKAGLRTALEGGHPPRRATQRSRAPSPRKITARQDRAREPFARNRLQLPAGAARRDHIVGTRGVSHFFETFLKKKYRKERSQQTQQPQPAGNPSAKPCSGARGRDTVEPSNPPAAPKYPKNRKSGQIRTKRRPRTLPQPNLSRLPLQNFKKKLRESPKTGHNRTMQPDAVHQQRQRLGQRAQSGEQFAALRAAAARATPCRS